MPIPFVVSSSDGYTGSMRYSRFGGPVFSGNLASGITGDVLPTPGACALIQSTAPRLTQLIATSGELARASFHYIAQGSFAVSSSTNAALAAAPPYTGMGAALYFDTTRFKLSVYSTVVGDWLSVTLTSS